MAAHEVSDISYQNDHMAWGSNPRNPHNWTMTKKAFIFSLIMISVLNSSMGSSLTSNAIPFIAKDFGVESQLQRVLPMSMFLIGYVFGPLLWAPLSEEFGRRPIITTNFLSFTLFTLACALAPNWASFLIFRLLTGIFASSSVALAPGFLADIYQNPETRGWSIAIFMGVTGFGPMIGPIVSGFVSPSLGWRWSFWIALAFAGSSALLLSFLPETYGRVLEVKYTENSQKRQNHGLKDIIVHVVLRPLRFLVSELIVSACSAYLALCYSIFYMSFAAFPIIFQQLYGLSLGQCGLVQLSIGAGCVLALPIYYMYEKVLRRAQANKRPWTAKEEYRRLPLAFLGGPLFVVSLFWLAWTSRVDVPFAVPMLAGIPFGMGFMCIFIALLNYMTDAYDIYAASASAASSCCRSFFAAILPLATSPMFQHLGISGACSLLGGLSVLMSIIPFILIFKGEKIRAKSKFCSALKMNRHGHFSAAPEC